MFPKFLWGVAFAATFLAFCEIVLRILGPSVTPVVVRTENEGYQTRPNLDSVHWSVESKKLIRFRTNEFGARDGSWSMDGKPPPIRIAVIGDSYVAAVQVIEGHRFTDILERRMRAAGLRTIVMNFGVNGQEIVNYLDRTIAAQRRFRPDFFVIGVANAADFRHIHATTFRDGNIITYSVDDGRFVNTARPFTKGEALLRRAKQIAREFWLAHLFNKAIEVMRRFVNSTTSENIVLKDCPIPPATTNEEAIGPFHFTAGILKEAATVVNNRLVVLQIPSSIQVEGKGSRDCDMQRPEHLFRQVVGPLPVIQFYRPLLRHNGPTYFPGGHLNKAGHKIVAERLFQHFAPLAQDILRNRSHAASPR